MKTRFAPYAAIFLTMIGLWYFLTYAPLKAGLVAIDAHTVELYTELADFQKTMKELPRFIENTEKLEKMREDLNARLYAKDDILDLFQLLDLEAQKRDLTITEITPPIEELLHLNNILPHSMEPPFLNISLKLEGGYVNFGEYVDFIEQASFFRGVNYCRIERPLGNTSHISLQLDFKALLGGVAEGT